VLPGSGASLLPLQRQEKPPAVLERKHTGRRILGSSVCLAELTHHRAASLGKKNNVAPFHIYFKTLRNDSESRRAQAKIDAVKCCR
jgi:hypothetical protein